SCPKCGPTTIAEGDATWTIDGKPVALNGHATACGAKLIASLPA
ncbi:PAAR domain-containing protein, partial [Pseudomonas parafulva]